MNDRHPQEQRRTLATVRRPFATWLAWLALWILVVGGVDAPDLLLGGIVAAIATLAASTAARHARTSVALPARWAAGLAGLPVDVVTEWALLLAVLARRIAAGVQPRGEFRIVRLAAADADRREPGRRASITVLSSFAPNTYVVRFVRDGAAVLVHQLVPRPPRIRGAA